MYMQTIILFILAMWPIFLAAEPMLSFPAREIIITDIEMAASAAAHRRRAQNIAKNDCEGRGVFASRGTYTWARVPDEIPDDYSTMGFGSIRPKTNDLDSGFCQIIVSAFTPEGDIWHAFFALGDNIICGSWVPPEEIYDPFIECAAGGAVLGSYGDLITLH